MRRTHMLDEIHEQPAALARAIDQARQPAEHLAAEIERAQIDLILVAARGTSDHAAIYAQYLFQYLNGIPVALATPSLFTLYDTRLALRHALVMGISQSGEAPDVLEVVEQARRAGALTAAITNAPESPLARAAHATLLCAAGAELSVAATKTYTTTAAVVAVLAAALPGGAAFGRVVAALPEQVAAALATEPTLARAVARYVHAPQCVVLGRAFQLCTAREAALKLEETCYLVATAFSTADFRHGPAALVEHGLPIMLFAAPGPTLAESIELLEWLRGQGADCIVVSEDQRLLALATTPVALALPPLPMAAEQPAEPGRRASLAELVAPIAYVVPGQLFAHYLALERGLDPDAPRGLAKITRTR